MPESRGPRRGAHAGPPARESEPPSAPAAPRHRPPRPLSLRPRTVRARIVALLMVPVVSVLALWGFASVTTARDVWDLLRLREAHATVLTPVGDTVTALQAERAAAGQLLAAPGVVRESALREAATATDRALAPLLIGRGYNRADAQGLGPEAAARLDELGGAVGALPALRTRVLARGVGWPEAYAAYGAAVDRAFAVTGALTPLQDHRVASDARVLLEFARSRELLAREDALLRAGQLAGALTEDQLREFAGAVYARRQLLRGAADDLRPEDRAALGAVLGGPDHQDLTAHEEKVRTAADGRAAVAAVGAERWSVAAENTARALRAVDAQAGRSAAEREDPYALGLFTPAGIAVLLGLVGVVASLVISVQIGRGLVTDLIGLRNTALDLAGRKLPATMRRLRAGEEIDIVAEAPAPAPSGDEIGQVRGALGTVQRAAVTAAVERAEVLSGVSGVFVNLARRSQVLVHRQLSLLDAMERRTEDPAELADLFRLDHLTTRMRRHAEGLIILSGAAPGRAWRKPVPLLDVVRAAVAEVEEYARVEVHRLPYAALTGPAVADLTHLIAELVENATGFSPPHTKVHIRGEQVGNGYALEIEDRGLGMGGQALGEANRRIAAAEQTALFDSDRLGLFVVSRLARRHGVKVALQTSAYGGTTAVVLLPTALLEARAPEQWVEPTKALPPVEELDVPVAEPAPERLPAAGGPPPEGGVLLPFGARSGDPGNLLPFGARGGDPGVLRPTPFRAPGARTDGPAADDGPGVAGRPQPGPVAEPRYGARREPWAGPGHGTGPGPDPEELPRRVRQASLVPQLRDAPPGPRPGTRRPAGPAPGREPEQARAAMSAFQAGWARGRHPEQQHPHGDQYPHGDRHPHRDQHPHRDRPEGEQR